MDKNLPVFSLVIAVTFSLALPARAFNYTVNAADDAGGGSCTAAHCSLRQAIAAANLGSGDNIVFGLPVKFIQSCPALGVCVRSFTVDPIIVTGSLPALVRPVTIDGTSQPTVHFVEVRGGAAGLSGIGLWLAGGSDGSVIRGLAVTHFDTGVEVDSSHNQVANCHIGIDGAGAPRGNATGVRVQGDHNLIGGPGTNTFDRNVISGNSGPGVGLCRDCRPGAVAGTTSAANQVSGNFIGTNLAGTAAMGNQDGVEILGNGFNATVSAYSSGANQNIIGGFELSQGNVISGNSRNGVFFSNPGFGPNFIGANFIGLSASGDAALPNATGVELDDAPNTTVGLLQGTCSPQPCLNFITGRNWISGNTHDGVHVVNTVNTAGVAIPGNCIGTAGDSACATPVGNGGDGIDLTGGLPLKRNSVGGVFSSQFNVIAFNEGAGVRVGISTDGQVASMATGWTIRGNRMTGNGSLGIDETNGTPPAAGSLNLPTLTGASGFTASGTVKGIAAHPLTLDFYASESCDPSGFGEGNHYLGSGTVNPSSSQTPQPFSINPGPALPSGEFLTATATDPNGTTFEFSKCLAIP